MVVLLAYPLSYGPVLGMHHKDHIPRWVALPCSWLFAPARWLALEGPEPARSAYHQYLSLGFQVTPTYVAIQTFRRDQSRLARGIVFRHPVEIERARVIVFSWL